MKRPTAIVFLILSALYFTGCSKDKSTNTETVTVTQIQTRTILGIRNTNNTSVTLENLVDGAQTVSSGSYNLQCDVTWTNSQNIISQQTSTLALLIRNGLQYMAQSFVAEETGTLSSVAVKISYSGGATTTTSVYIYDSLPSGGAAGSPLASAVLNISGTGEEWVTAAFVTPPSLQKNSTYYLVVKNSAATDVSWYVNTTGNPYAGGTAHVANSGTGFNFSQLPSGDMAFVTTIDYQHSPAYQYRYNGVSSVLYSTYPSGQEISIDGGVAGILKFKPSAVAPSISGADTITVLVQ